MSTIVVDRLLREPEGSAGAEMLTLLCLVFDCWTRDSAERSTLDLVFGIVLLSVSFGEFLGDDSFGSRMNLKGDNSRISARF